MAKNTLLWNSADSFARGEWYNLAAAGDALTLSLCSQPAANGGSTSGYAARGTFTTPEMNAPAYRELVASWNAAVPHGAAVEIAVRARANGSWSRWFSWGVWGIFRTRESAPAQEDGIFKQKGDTLTASTNADGFQLRATLMTTDAQVSPVLRLAAVSVRSREAAPAAPIKDGVPTQQTVPVPAYAETIRDPRMAGHISGPASLTMLLNRHGEDLLPEEVAHVCYDAAQNGWSNRSFLAAAAGSYGYESYMCFADFAQLQKEIRGGCACGACVHYSNNASTAAEFNLPFLPEASGTAQRHMLVVRGLVRDDEGNASVLVNDPLASCDDTAARAYPLAEFMTIWTGELLVLHRPARTPVLCRPQRICAVLQRGELPGEYVLLIDGVRHSIPPHFTWRDNTCTGTVCYNVRDAHAYATAGHRCFFYTDATESGGIRLDLDHLPAGTRLTVYLIDSHGNTVVAEYTVGA